MVLMKTHCAPPNRFASNQLHAREPRWIPQLPCTSYFSWHIDLGEKVMAFHSLSFVLAFLMWLAPQTATPQNTDATAAATAKANTAAPPNAPSVDEVIDR